MRVMYNILIYERRMKLFNTKLYKIFWFMRDVWKCSIHESYVWCFDSWETYEIVQFTRVMYDVLIYEKRVKLFNSWETNDNVQFLEVI